MASKLDKYDDAVIIGKIANGMSQSAIAKELGVSFQLLSVWLQKEGRRDLAQDARRQSAEIYIEKAEAVLLDKTMEVARARELANHYRQVAKIRNPAEYGDRIDISGKVDHQHSVASLIASLGPTCLIGSAYQIEAEEAEIIAEEAEIIEIEK